MFLDYGLTFRTIEEMRRSENLQNARKSDVKQEESENCNSDNDSETNVKIKSENIPSNNNDAGENQNTLHIYTCNDLQTAQISNASLFTPQFLNNEYMTPPMQLLYIHSAHCALIVHYAKNWQLDSIESALFSFWISSDNKCNCYIISESQLIENFIIVSYFLTMKFIIVYFHLKAESSAYQVSVEYFQSLVFLNYFFYRTSYSQFKAIYHL